VRRIWVVVLGVVVAIGIAVVAAAISRGGDSKPSKPAVHPPAASQQFGDDADLMRKLERKKLVKHEP
jgi:hypothetical protein